MLGESYQCVKLRMPCAGRGPVTKGIGLEEVGVELTKRNKVVVDKKFKTNVDGIFAIGDVIEGPMLAHKVPAFLGSSCRLFLFA